MFKRRRIKQTQTLQRRLEAFAKGARQRAAALAPGPERDALLKKARAADTAIHLDEWANSNGLQSPK
ncbi:hypothetical protein JQ604_25960 [Bradyrhizobium jicamae]|nr:hypothetical protein [Bradyrhizobium jicamae]MBR0755638.1 hypothetical protein [Bradyrhizobium jicamae]